MDLRHVESILKDSENGGLVKKKEALVSKLDDRNEVDFGTALQLFLDHISVDSIVGIRNSQVLELNSDDCLQDAIRLLYEKNVSGALIAGVLESDSTGRYSDRYVGFVQFASMVLWSLEEREKTNADIINDDGETININEFFSMLEQIPQIGKTKVGDLAKSFLWYPFLPVYTDDTFFHVLLLFSKHRLQVVPVIERSNSCVLGFVTQNAVVQLLLQSSGLEFFDRIANKALSEFRFERGRYTSYVYGDQSLAHALHILWENQVDGIPVVNRETKKLIGTVRSNDVHLLLDNIKLFHNRKIMNVEEFIHLDVDVPSKDPTLDLTINKELGTLISAGNLRIKDDFHTRMDFPVTNRKTDTLKQVMEVLTGSASNRSFLVDEFQSIVGVVTLRDIIMQFAPPLIDSRINGGGFFESALEQAGCHMENGIMKTHR